MNILTAEEILQKTFEQLEKMVDEKNVERQGTREGPADDIMAGEQKHARRHRKANERCTAEEQDGSDSDER